MEVVLDNLYLILIIQGLFHKSGVLLEIRCKDIVLLDLCYTTTTYV
jgi:hypothetical protein